MTAINTNTYLYLMILFMGSYTTLKAQSQVDPLAIDIPQTAENDFKPIYLDDLKIEDELQDVPSISMTALQQYIEDGKDFILLDARDRRDFEVSHIPNAHRVGYNDFTVENFWFLRKEKRVVVYGVTEKQSSQVVACLASVGFYDVLNLKGDIIEWVNAGNSLENKSGKKTTEVYLADRKLYSRLKAGKLITPQTWKRKK